MSRSRSAPDRTPGAVRPLGRRIRAEAAGHGVDSWPEPRTATGFLMQAAVSSLFQLIKPALPRLQSEASPGACLRPGTLVVFNHKRDTDIPLLAQALFGPRSWPDWIGRITFAGRSDLFVPGFLALQFPQIGPARRLLFPLDLTAPLRAVGIVAVRKTGPRLAIEWLAELAEVFGADHPASGLLHSVWLERFVAAGGRSSATLRELLDWRYRDLLGRPVDATILCESAERRLLMHEAREAVPTLSELTEALESGGLLVMAPEGNLTSDGILQPFRSGALRLLQRVPGASVLPLCFTYDLLVRGRPTAFLRIGRTFGGLAELSRRECESRVRREIMQLSTITLAQIVARLVFEELPDGVSEVSREALFRRIRAEVYRLATSGQHVDARLLDAATLRRRLAVLLCQARGRGLEEAGSAVRLDWDLLHGPVDGWEVNPLGYAYNEVRSVAAAMEQEGAPV